MGNIIFMYSLELKLGDNFSQSSILAMPMRLTSNHCFDLCGPLFLADTSEMSKDCYHFLAG